ncbi:hypothetical protein [Mariniradius sediminis]|uniref:Addiction module component n=1 Tax=Mariniradius sediminis TaxID=2909237 RepID=A0ABS9BQ77_9BACT|nr:hypothetical protein [Mariniradius sediminis]MCF1750213.1 hypothetical protein [Mariniradius sediminis]
MSTLELKIRLIEKIDKIEDENLLKEVIRLLELSAGTEDMYNLDLDQKAVIAEARNQIKNGQFLTEDKANQEIDEWLNK